ncbi:MAG TPA: DUF2235 domain-containing protein [Vicinamibacterales bacterium]|nr:DUF2235 domain-containing protein [Vicinamibacterales bacterium]
MPKRIVVCSDGTGNTAIKGRGTNVFKLFEAVDLESHRYDSNATPQIAIYDDGVGTERFKPLKILSGATGWGLSRNVKHLYKELARVYDPGDDIYMFGFSRGAFTVRTLVGFIQACGLVDPDRLQPQTFASLQRVVKKGYKAYRQCYRPALWRRFFRTKADAGEQFKRAHSRPGAIPIRFVGVWDTVDAVGLPFHLSDAINATLYQFKFSDHTLSPMVRRACQALAIDDQRESFAPLLWHEQPGDASRITQVWFAGAHSNVGGGYPKQGMSLVALDWLLSEAERRLEPAPGEAADAPTLKGLRIYASERQSFREHASVDDKLYDPRAGAGMFYRWKVRDIAKLCAENNVTPRVHVSVLERIAHGTDDYSPGNLPPNAEVVFTPPPIGDSVHARRRAKAAARVLATIPQRTLLDRVRGLVRLGTASYYLYLASCGVGAVALAGAMAEAIRLRVSDEADGVAVAAALGFAAAYLIALFVDRRMESVFSGFWYPKQRELRDGFKQARRDSRDEVAKPAA